MQVWRALEPMVPAPGHRTPWVASLSPQEMRTIRSALKQMAEIGTTDAGRARAEALLAEFPDRLD